MTDKLTLQAILDDAAEYFEEHLDWLDASELETMISRDGPHDAIAEIADTSVPVMTHDLIQVAASNVEMATLEPDIGPAFDGSPTPTNIIAANIYEAVSNHLFTWWSNNKNELIKDIDND